MTFHIRRTEPLAAGLRRIAREQIGIVISSFEDPELPDTEKVHRLRARCKKMRALLRLPGPLMGDAFRSEDARFRDAGRRLGELRDEYVQARTLAHVLSEEGDEAEPDRDAFAAEPSMLAESLAAMRAALAAVDEWPLPVEGYCDIGPGHVGTYRKARKAWQRALKRPDDEHFHKLRKWTKYHWYQTRILERVNKAAMRERRVRLQVLGEVLGQAHDLAVLEAGLDGRGESTGRARHQIDRQKRRLYVRALKLSREVYDQSPDALAADLARWWCDWRAEA